MYLTDQKEIYDLYKDSEDEAREWRRDYPEYERLADNGLLEDLDETLPEVNDGSLAAALFKLPKRIVNSDLKGRAKAIDRDEAWVSELANMQWENEIIPNANTQAPFHRKWKDAVRKAAIYGSVPIITLFTERGDYTGADFIVAQPQDVLLEASKVSDYDSDVVFWDVYFTELQLKNMIERAKREMKEADNDGESYSKWYVQELETILASKNDDDVRDSERDYEQMDDKDVRRKGYKFCIVFQRGVNAPFYMYYPATKKTVREWTNQDPTGDIPVHYLYCYQDFVNPYGIGIVKLAGGTQNVLDYMRQADVLATQLGFRPPVSFSGDLDGVDFDSIVYEQDAQWYVGNATVRREEISNQIYAQLPNRMSMYKISLNQLIPTGDTSISAGAGDQDYSKTPAGVAFQQQSLSIDDEDFKDNLYITYEQVARSMLNIHFANMQGTDFMKLSDDERKILIDAGMDWPVDEQTGELIETNELEVLWDETRASFDFEMEAEQDKAKDEEKRLEGLLRVMELVNADPNSEMYLQMSGKKLNRGELLGEIISLTSDNDKIIEDISPEEQQAMTEEQAMGQMMQGEFQPNVAPGESMPQNPAQQVDPEMEVEMNNIQAIMEQYGVPANVAAAMRSAEVQGASTEEIALLRDRLLADDQEGANV